MNTLPPFLRACQLLKCMLRVSLLILKNIYLLITLLMLIEQVNIIDLFKHFII